MIVGALGRRQADVVPTWPGGGPNRTAVGNMQLTLRVDRELEWRSLQNLLPVRACGQQQLVLLASQQLVHYIPLWHTLPPEPVLSSGWLIEGTVWIYGLLRATQKASTRSLTCSLPSRSRQPHARLDPGTPLLRRIDRTITGEGFAPKERPPDRTPRTHPHLRCKKGLANPRDSLHRPPPAAAVAHVARDTLVSFRRTGASEDSATGCAARRATGDGVDPTPLAEAKLGSGSPNPPDRTQRKENDLRASFGVANKSTHTPRNRSRLDGCCYD